MMLFPSLGVSDFPLGRESRHQKLRLTSYPTRPAGPQILLYKTLSLHMPRPVVKRAAGVALLNALGGTGNIWGSYLWLDPLASSPGLVSALEVSLRSLSP